MSTTTIGAVFARPARGNWLWLALIWLVLLTVPLWIGALGGYTALATRVLIFGLAAMGLNFLLGFTGVMSFGHAAYFGLGCLRCRADVALSGKQHAARHPGRDPAGSCGWWPVRGLIVRRKGVYFAMLTIAFGQICYYVAYSWNDFTGGYDGLRGFQRQPISVGPWLIDIQNNGVTFYYFVLFVFAVCVTLMALLLRSPFGRTLIAIRENERRARFLGIPIERHVWLSFTISTFFTAVAGALYALLNNFADPSTLYYVISGDIVIMAVMGGMRSFWGPLLGAAVFVVLQDTSRP